MMSCNSKMTAKQKITILSISSVASIAATYFAFTIHNPALAVIAPVLLAFVPCLVMCGVVGGSMLLVPRLSKNKKQPSCNCGLHHSTKQEETEKVPKNWYWNYLIMSRSKNIVFVTSPSLALMPMV